MSSSEQPKIMAFLCNWCAYAGADLAGVSRMQYPPHVRLIRLMFLMIPRRKMETMATTM